MAAVAPLRALYTDSCSYAHRPFVRAARARVSVYTRALAYSCTRVCASVCALCCCVVPCGPGLLRPGGAAVGTQNGRRLGQRVYDGSPPRGRAVTRVRRSPRRWWWLPVGRANCRERAHFRHPWTAARIPGRQLPSPRRFVPVVAACPPPAALRRRRAVFHRCVRIIMYTAETSTVRA